MILTIMKLKNKIEPRFRFKIDTMQLRTSVNNIEDLAVFEQRKFGWVKRVDRTLDDMMVFKIHLSGCINDSDVCDAAGVVTYTEQMKVKEKMLEALGVNSLFGVEGNRLDLCFDTVIEFEEMFKYSDCLRCLYAMCYSTNNAFDNLNVLVFEIENMKVFSRYNELEIYNKKKQSNGRYPYNTRIEFRFKNTKSDEETKIKDLVELLDRMIGKFELFEERRAEALCKKYVNDFDKGIVKNLTQFVNANKGYVTSVNVCKMIYERVMPKKSGYGEWIKGYRRNNNIEFLTKSEMKGVVEEMKRAVSVYMNA